MFSGIEHINVLHVPNKSSIKERMSEGKYLKRRLNFLRINESHESSETQISREVVKGTRDETNPPPKKAKFCLTALFSEH